MILNYVSLQANEVFKCAEPDPAVRSLRPDYEELRHGDVSNFDIRFFFRGRKSSFSP